jgi:hypothetical protein
MASSKRKKLGIIQSRGLGDIVIALPIAKYYYDRGWDIFWPICEEFISNVIDHVPWVKWIPVKTDSGSFFYDVPHERLKNFGCDEIIPLYQHLTGHDFIDAKYFQFTKFDQYKYLKAGVPFLEKWKLADCITRFPNREQTLYNTVVQNPNYAVIHLEGSDARADFDRSMIPTDWQTVEILPRTGSVFDWLLVLEKAQSLIMIDSVFANMIDQIGLGEDHYFIQRSHIGLTPVLNLPWTWLP